MKKIVIVVMLLASSTFGATLLTVTPASQAPTPVTNQVTFTFGLTGVSPLTVVAYTIKTSADTLAVAQQLKYVSRADLTGTLTDPTFAAPTGKTANQITDMGFSSSDPVNANVKADGPLMTYTFSMVAPPTANLTIKFVGGTSVWDGTFDEFGFPNIVDGPQFQGTTAVITPEPASMLLLAVGGLFFARRRRA